MRTHTPTGAGDSAAQIRANSKPGSRKVSPITSAEIVGYINWSGNFVPVPKTRRKLVAVMPDGTRRSIYKSKYSGWNLPDGCCFTSSLASAKQEWRKAGATIETESVPA